MKKLLLSALLTSALVCNVSAKEFTEGTLTFRTTSATTAEVAKGADKTTEFTVPQTVTSDGVTYTVTAIGENAFKWSDATKIVLPSTIDSIKSSAFDASDLAEINLPDGLTYIGKYAFDGVKMAEFVCPKGLKKIDGSAFFAAKTLKSITFNDGLEEIGESCFYRASITKAILPESLKVLGAKAFLYCGELTEVKLPSTLTQIGAGTFYQCKKLASVDIPAGVESIGDEAFLECTAMTEIALPASLKQLGTSVFSKTAITSYKLADGNKDFALVSGVLYGSDKKLLYAVPMKGVSEVKVDSKCIGINGGAFWGSEVAKVTLPDGMLAIDDYAFCQSALAEINFPSSLTFIGEQGFASTKMTKLVLPENLVYIYDGTFAGMENLTELVIPSSVKLILNHAFHNDKKLASVTCLGSVAPILDDVYEEYDSPFYGVSTSTPLYVPKGSEDSYKKAGWGSYFKITASETGVLTMTGADPADGTVLKDSYQNMAATISFGSEISIVQKNPEVYLRKGSELSGAIVPVDDKWVAILGSDKKSVRIWASDYDGYTMSFKPETETNYFLIIPAGTVKDAAGNMNERIVLTWHGPAKPQVAEVVSTSPAVGATVKPGYMDMAFDITFSSDITVEKAKPAAILWKGEINGGSKEDPDDCWMATKQSDGKTVRIWGADYDMFTQSFKAVKGTTYNFVLPAGVIKDAEGNLNAEIVITFKCDEGDGVDSISGETAVEVARYDLQGRPVGDSHTGLTIVRMSDGSVRKVVVK